ncbi:hypothetical protein GE107_25980 [Cohnella sp. CFH 77786]|uniref:hypothetical protein n=1 Tax=Cohnella sp. CFH 77786 TaxID=2662265 RepID=UPI001C60ED7E|nr:hypothetical protein [Cohnella sp. CFH 77786]MBW5449462.1 hypothetical protein [Cohnella sp. CFH 77786]
MSQATLELILNEMRNFRTEVNEEFQSVRTEIQAVRSELKEEIQAVRSELKDEIQAVRSELKDEIQAVTTELRAELKADIQSARSEFAQELKTFKKDQQAILNRLNSQEKLSAQLVGMVKSIKETVTEIAERQDAMERKFSFQLNTHAASIEILNREQLMIKTEIEMLKNQY